jgi:hypothetical protein
MRYLWLGLAGLCASAGVRGQISPAPTCADLHLVPAVRECLAVEALPIGEAGLVISGDAEDAKLDFVAHDLTDDLTKKGVPVNEHDAPSILFFRADSRAGIHFLKEIHLQFDPAMKEEGYLIAPAGIRSVFVIAASSAGFFYGAQTIKQLIRGSGKDAVLLVPTIRDWPAMAHRGLSDDWSRGPLPNMEFLKREIRTLAAYKYNIFSPYFEHTFAYKSAPVPAFPGGAMTPEEAKELVAYAEKNHITIIPEQESFGHLHHVLKFEQYSHLGETEHGAVLAPGDAATLPQIKSWFDELAAVFPGPWAHVGADETFELGLGRTRAEVKEKGLGAVYLSFLSRIHETLAPNKKNLLFWGDVAVNSPELVGTLPKEMIAVPWRYDAEPDFKPLIEPFTKAGLETWVAPGVNNWNRLYPNNNEALGNIRAFVRDGQKLGAAGMLNTVWNDDGEGIFDENWVGVLFGAAAAWQPGESSEQVFLDSFAQAFHRDETGKISEAQRELMAAHAAFRKAGLEDAYDSYFWIDPFSPEGRKRAAKIRPALAEIRLHAEKAIQLTAEARAAAKAKGGELENPEALAALELGARRIDFVGLKFQAADDCIALYAEAQAMAGEKSRWGEVEDMLETIGSNNGRIEDMRDGYALLRGLYERAWLVDNRPYWLQNNLARYDAATQLWVGRSDRWRLVEQGWWDTHTLPPAAEVGLPPAVQ